jgi:alkylated DNA repair dioxygenase AlkB
MLAANQLGLFSGDPAGLRSGEQAHERSAIERSAIECSAIERSAIERSAIERSEAVRPDLSPTEIRGSKNERLISERLELARSSTEGSGNLKRGITVDAAFERAERYILSVQFGRTSLVPVTSVDECSKPEVSWVEHVPSWLKPDRSLFEALLSDCDWQQSQRKMYERVVDVPRLLAQPKPRLRSSTLLQALAQLLSARYRRSLTTSTLALYRDGNDSVAPHGDKLGALVNDTVVAILSLGYQRMLRLRPNSSQRGLRSIDFPLSSGDLFVMGGRCQADWLHGVPKVRTAGARICVVYREPDGGIV